MGTLYNIYCDESCHLEHDGKPVMVLGAVWCPAEKCTSITKRLNEIKQKHEMPPRFEVKWQKVGPKKIGLYLDWLDFFFDHEDMHFRALIAPKGELDHARHSQTHDEWYYKMYFNMLKILFEPSAKYHIYLDIKDSRGGEKVRKLHDVLCNNQYDFSHAIIERVQIIRSQESHLLQLADLLIGVISYVNRNLSGNAGKESLVRRMKNRSGYELTKTTLFREEKVNLFHWTPSEGRE